MARRKAKKPSKKQLRQEVALRLLQAELHCLSTLLSVSVRSLNARILEVLGHE